MEAHVTQKELRFSHKPNELTACPQLLRECD
jgi:hypothetical protein